MHIGIWDQLLGLIGELEWCMNESPCFFKPVFSPDSQILLAPLTEENEEESWPHIVTGIQAILIPSADADKDSIAGICEQ